MGNAQARRGSYLNTSTDVVSSWRNWDWLRRDVNALAQALGSDVGEVGANVVWLAVADVQKDVCVATLQHLVLNGSRHNVTGG